MNGDIYGGTFLPAGVNFSAVRDGRRAPVFYFDVDLSTSRSKAAGTALVVTVAGDSFYSDLDPNNQGYATVYFQDVTLTGAAPAPAFVCPGSIFNVPFTQLLIENTAQTGKRLRVLYGVGVDFRPGTSSQVTLSGRVDVNDVIGVANQRITGPSGAAVGTTVSNMLPAASNVNGAIIRAACLDVNSGAGGQTLALIVAAATAPATSAGKTNAITLAEALAPVGGVNGRGEYTLSRRIPASWGIWCVTQTTGAVGSLNSVVDLELL